MQLFLKIFSLFCALQVLGKQVVIFDSSSSSTSSSSGFSKWETLVTGDGTSAAEIGWISEANETSIERVYSSCSPKTPINNSNNRQLLFPPFFSTERALSLMVTVKFTMLPCEGSLSRCTQSVSVFSTEFEDYFVAKRFKPNNGVNWNGEGLGAPWKKLGVLHVSNNDGIEMQTLSTKLEKNTNYILLSFEANDACVSIYSIKAFYFECELKRHGVGAFVDTIADHQEDVMVKGWCPSPDSRPTIGLEPVAFCKPNGEWRDKIIGECECLLGHQLETLNGREYCRPCPWGFYKEHHGSVPCLPCPRNSVALSLGNGFCPCVRGFHRRLGEANNSSCTQHPGRPSNPRLKFLDDTSLEISWTQPENLGGRSELWYEWECVEGPCSILLSDPREKKMNTTILRIFHLVADYSIKIYAKNLVSAFVEGEDDSFIIAKVEARKEVIRNLRVDEENGLLIWDPELKDGLFEVEILSKNGNETSFITTSKNEYSLAELSPGVHYAFRVRAFVDEWSRWSVSTDYEKKNESSNAWLILGYVVLVVMVVALCIAAWICWRKCCKRTYRDDFDLSVRYNPKGAKVVRFGPEVKYDQVTCENPLAELQEEDEVQRPRQQLGHEDDEVSLYSEIH